MWDQPVEWFLRGSDPSSGHDGFVSNPLPIDFLVVALFVHALFKGSRASLFNGPMMGL